MARPSLLLACLALALAAPAAARDGGLRGPQGPDSAPPPSSAGLPAQATAAQELLASALTDPAPRFSRDPAPRVGGYAPADGLACRRACANDSYFCRVDTDVSDCNRAWTQCLAACRGG